METAGAGACTARGWSAPSTRPASPARRRTAFVRRARHPGWGAEPSPFLDPQSAGRRPLLDAGEIVIGAVAVGPHRQVQGCVGLFLVVEGADQRFQLGSSLDGRGVRRLWLVALLD